MVSGPIQAESQLRGAAEESSGTFSALLRSSRGVVGGCPLACAQWSQQKPACAEGGVRCWPAPGSSATRTREGALTAAAQRAGSRVPERGKGECVLRPELCLPVGAPSSAPL